MIRLIIIKITNKPIIIAIVSSMELESMDKNIGKINMTILMSKLIKLTPIIIHDAIAYLFMDLPSKEKSLQW